jgi:hypothetical protein
MKTLLASLLCYLAATCALASALVGGVAWLIRVDASGGAPAREVPIPPRIAESIDRKKAFVPPQLPQAPSAPANPMQQANVALTQPSTARPVIRELTSSSPQRKTGPRTRKQSPAREGKEMVAPSYQQVPDRRENLSGL